MPVTILAQREISAAVGLEIHVKFISVGVADGEGYVDALEIAELERSLAPYLHDGRLVHVGVDQLYLGELRVLAVVAERRHGHIVVAVGSEAGEHILLGSIALGFLGYDDSSDNQAIALRVLEIGVLHLLAIGGGKHKIAIGIVAVEIKLHIMPLRSKRESIQGRRGDVFAHHKGVVSIYQRAYRLAAGRDGYLPGTLQKTLLELFGSETLTAEIRQQQSSHAAHVRAGHRGAGKGLVATVGVGAYDGTARGAEVHPVAIVREARLVAAFGDGTHGKHLGIASGHTVLYIIVASGKHHQAALHKAARKLVAVVVATRILYKIVDGTGDGGV